MNTENLRVDTHRIGTPRNSQNCLEEFPDRIGIENIKNSQK